MSKNEKQTGISNTEAKYCTMNDNYIDLLSDRRSGSDVRFSIREWSPSVSYKYGELLDKETLFKKVVNSERVKKAMGEVS